MLCQWKAWLSESRLHRCQCIHTCRNNHRKNGDSTDTHSKSQIACNEAMVSSMTCTRRLGLTTSNSSHWFQATPTVCVCVYGEHLEKEPLHQPQWGGLSLWQHMPNQRHQNASWFPLGSQTSLSLCSSSPIPSAGLRAPAARPCSLHIHQLREDPRAGKHQHPS